MGDCSTGLSGAAGRVGPRVLSTHRRYVPLVTVITPSLNQAAYLPATLQSVDVQDYPSIEHIVLDGGSTDGSVEILGGWAARHTFAWRSEPDKGQADAIHRGVDMGSGEIIAWLNSDDVYLDAHVITDVVRAFASGARIVTGGGWYLAEDGRRMEHIPVFTDRLTFDTLKHVDWILQPATFVSRELMIRCPLDTSLHYAFDWDLFIRLSKLSPLTPIDRDIAGYRLHENGKTVSGAGRRQLELLGVTRRYCGVLSPSYLVLLPVAYAHLLAQRAPSRLYRNVARFLQLFAILTNRLTNGRGIQF
jgi:glycosyltransferase involved in cell wall biosynthesis